MGAVYTQLSMQDRRKIERWRYANVPLVTFLNGVYSSPNRGSALPESQNLS